MEMPSVETTHWKYTRILFKIRHSLAVVTCSVIMDSGSSGGSRIFKRGFLKIGIVK